MSNKLNNEIGRTIKRDAGPAVERLTLEQGQPYLTQDLTNQALVIEDLLSSDESPKGAYQQEAEEGNLSITDEEKETLFNGVIGGHFKEEQEAAATTMEGQTVEAGNPQAESLNGVDSHTTIGKDNLQGTTDEKQSQSASSQGLPTTTTEKQASTTAEENVSPLAADEPSSPISTPMVSPHTGHLTPARDSQHITDSDEREDLSPGIDTEKSLAKETLQSVETENTKEAYNARDNLPSVRDKAPLPTVEETHKESPLPSLTQEQATPVSKEESLPPIGDKKPVDSTNEVVTHSTSTEETWDMMSVETVEPLTGEADVQEVVGEPDESITKIIEKISEEPEKEITPTWEIWHTDPHPDKNILLAIAFTLIASKIGGQTAKLLGAPTVVGMIIIGMLMGNISFLTGSDFFDFLRGMPFLKMLADFGALTLLFSTGLHTDLRAILRIGVSSILVTLGFIVASSGLGFLVGHLLLPDSSLNTRIIIALILCVSSMGIKIKVLEELQALNTLEGRIIIGGAILADILALLLFGVASGILIKGSVPLVGVATTVGIIFLFLSAIIVTSLKYTESLGRFFTWKVPEALQISTATTICLILAFTAELIGMHTIVGAFAAGLLLQNMRLREGEKSHGVELVMRPFNMLLVPILFVRAGALVRWEQFLDVNTVLLGLALTCASVSGSLFSGLCPIQKGINRLAVGLAMVPKLEVTLILASVAKSMELLSDAIFSSFILVVMLTSTLSPPLLKLTLSKKEEYIKLSKKEALVSASSPTSYLKEEKRKAKLRLRMLGLR